MSRTCQGAQTSSDHLARTLRMRSQVLVNHALPAPVRASLMGQRRPASVPLTSSSTKERHMRHRISTGVVGAAVTAAALIAAAVPAQAASSAVQHNSTAKAGTHHASPAFGGSGLLSYG